MDNEYSELVIEIITLANELDMYDKEASREFNILLSAMVIITVADKEK